MHKVCIIHNESSVYPEADGFFRPSIDYPEYLFGNDLTKQNNVYDMVRQGFITLGMDLEHYNTHNWNPFKEIVFPGDTVLIKPNLVIHFNGSGCGVECVYTHPSVVAAVIDYVLIALKGCGRIIIGDAPVQECDFNELISRSGYGLLVDYYKTKGVFIELVDFRNQKTYIKDGLHYLQENEKDFGKLVRIDKESAFKDLDKDTIKDLRITNYDPRILQEYHKKDLHGYIIAEQVLDADVIINMPKPKTHRKAGVTISMKNLIGCCSSKTCLPHHTLGSADEGGDAYRESNDDFKRANAVLDIKNELVHEGNLIAAKKAEELYRILLANGEKKNTDEYWEGSWYGNDTIWRTVMDINRIVLYADKRGVMHNDRQRRHFIIADMIVSGQKEGPLKPIPINVGAIIMGDNSVAFDRIICSIMGFDYKKIPILDNEVIGGRERQYSLDYGGDYLIVSNNPAWDGKDCEEIEKNNSLGFQPSIGWIDKLGSKYRDSLLARIGEDEVYLFGAGLNGEYAYRVLSNYGVKVMGFIDNDESKHGRVIIDGLVCISPKDIKTGTTVVGCIKDKYEKQIEDTVIERGGYYCGTINRG